MDEHAIQTPRTARYYTLGAGAPARAVWVVAHGYGQLARYVLRHFAPVAAGGRLVVAPEGLSRFYLDGGAGGRYERVAASWMTRDGREDEIADHVRFLDGVLAAACARAGADPRAVPLVALGFSQGAATLARWLDRSPLLADRGAARADRLVLWGGDLPPDVDAARPWLRATALTLVAGDADEIATPQRVAAVRARLDAAGVPYRAVRYAGGHRLHAETLAALAAEPDRA